jgi:L-threonylcarbamoyladenylate synthase
MSKPSAPRVYRATPRNLAYLARQLQAGAVVGVPTETVYGLAGSALDPRACRRIFRAKRRPLNDPLIVHIHSLEQLADIGQPNAAALRLARRFWPGPLTIVLPKQAAVPDIVTAGQPSVAVRMPAHPAFRRLLRLCQLPLAAPSANRFGYVSPTTAEHVRVGLSGRIRHVLDGGPSHIGLESTIIDLRDPARPRLLRPGAITREQLQRALGCNVAAAPSAPNAGRARRAQLAPGLLARHYSPRTPVTLHDHLPDARNLDEAYVHLRRPPGSRRANVFWLDSRGDLRGVARRLFAVLRELDGKGFTRLHVERAPNEGIGLAINDRLQRAAAR